MEKLYIGMLSKEKPASIVDLNNGQGSFVYNHNIKLVDIIESEHGVTITADTKLATGKMYLHDSIRVDYPKTADNIFATILTTKYPVMRESKLINEYQSAMLGILPASSKQPYEDFLRDRLAIRKMVDEDCKVLNIPNSI